MAHIHDIKIGNTSYLIEPTLFGTATTSDNGANYTLSFANFELAHATGVAIQVKFPTTNTDGAKLNMNSIGAKAIIYNNAAIAANTLKANHTYTLVYDGTQWQLVGDIDTNTWRGISDAVNSDSSSVSASSKAVKTAYDLASTKMTKVTSTDNAVVRFDGTEGQVKNSGVIIDDSNNVTTTGHFILEKANNITWASGGQASEPAFEMKGATKAFKFKFSTSGENVDVGWDWAAGDGSGAFFRSTNATSNAGMFGFFARKTLSNGTKTSSELWGYASDTNNGGKLIWAGKRVVTATDGSQIGSATQPVYISNAGVATAISYTIEKSVPNDAKFSDTTYSAGTGLSLSSTTFNHSNSITAKTKYGSTSTSASANGGTIIVTDIKYDAQGHITASTDRTITLSQTTYNFTGVNFTSGNGDTGTQAADSITSNGHWSYTSEGPTSQLGAQSTTGALYTQAYSANWVGQIAQDYRDGQLFVRGKNNKVWQDWYAIPKFTTTTGGLGSTTQPVYIDTNGELQTISYTIAKSVPSNAVFTDHYAWGDITSKPDTATRWPKWSEVTDKATTLSGYGITDAKIASGVITLGSNTITPVTSIAGLTGNTITAANLRSNLGLTKALVFKGTTSTTNISDGWTGTPAGIYTSPAVPEVGDVVLDSNNDAEYVCTSVSGTTYTWELLGRSGSWATSDHTHTLSLASDSGTTNVVSLSAGTTYKLTAGGKSILLKTPEAYTHPSSAGNKHIPSGGEAGQFLQYGGSSGTASWHTLVAGDLPSHTHSGDQILGGYLNIHGENSGTIIPFMHNDLAFVNLRGGSYSAYVTTSTDYTAETLTSTATISLDSIFNGQSNYSNTGRTYTDVIVIDVTCHQTFPWSQTFYIDFGSVNWRAKMIRVLVKNANDETKYTLKGSTDNNTSGHYVCSVGHRSGTGFNRLRVVLGNWANTSNTDHRIAQVGIYSYSGAGAAGTLMSRGVDNAVWRNISVGTDNTYDIGSSTMRWKDIYAVTFNGALEGNASTATTLETSRSLWGNNFDGSADIAGSLTPSGNRTQNIGTSSNAFNDAHIRGIAVRHIDAGTTTQHSDSELYIGYGSVAATKKIRLYYSANTTSRTEYFQVNENGAYALTRFGVDGQNTNYNFYVNGTSYLKGNITATGICTFDHTGAGAIAAATVKHLLAVNFKNSANNTTYAANIVSYYGTDGTDGYNTCIRFGSSSGTTWITAGEGGVYMPQKVAYNDENLYLSADNNIVMYTSTANDATTYTQAVVISGGQLSTPNGNLWAGTNGNTTAERQVGVQSGAGQMYMWAAKSTTGARGIWLTAHGTGAAKAVFSVDTNNNVTFNGTLVGNADTATTSTWTTLIKPINAATTASASTWNIPSGSYQVWGERFSDTRLKYTPEGGSETTITDTGDWVMWLSRSGSNATLNMRIDGTYYGAFSGNVSGNASSATTSTYLTVSRVAEDCSTVSKAFPASNRAIIKEYTAGSSYHLPSNAWYHILNTQGSDTKYGTQLALGMTTAAVYYRRYDNSSWKDWLRLLDSGNTTAGTNNEATLNWDTTYTIAKINGTDIKFTTMSKPSYNWSDIGSKPITFSSTTYGTTGWKQLGGKASSQSSIVVFKPTDNAAVTWGTISHSAVIAWGNGDTKGMIDCSYNTPLVSIAGGNAGGSTDEAPKWYFKLSATSGKTYTLPTDSKTLCASDGSNASGNWGISITGNATNDSDGNAINTTYLQLSGGTMAGAITLTSQSSAFNSSNLLFSSGGIIGGNTSGNIGIYAETIYLRGGSNNTTNSGQGITVTGTQVNPYGTNEVSLGTSSLKYKNIYATTFDGSVLKLSNYMNSILTGAGTAAVTSGTKMPALWRFNLGIVSPTEGDIVTIKIPVAGHGNGVFVSLDNGTTYYPVSVSGTGALTTHYAKDQIITLVCVGSGGTNSIYPAQATINSNNYTLGTAANITGKHWCVVNYYDSGNTNTATRQKVRSTDGNYSLLFADPVVGTADNNTNYYTYRNDSIYVNPSTGNVYATTFNGALSGNATTATSATNDSDGNAIKSTYLKLSGGTVTGTLTLSKAQDASGTANNSPALIVGGAATSTHLEFDCNEIMAKESGTTTADLYINTNGNAVFLGKDSNGTNDYVSVRSTQAASSTSTGALRVAGGTGIAGALYVGGNTAIGTTTAGSLGLAQTNGTGLGISLYGGPKATGALEYGIMFAKTATFGKLGGVSSDWATYFTMNRNDARGWIFKSNGGAANGNNNVTSIAANGNIYTIGSLTINKNDAGAIYLSRSDGPNWIQSSAQPIAFCINATLAGANGSLRIADTYVDSYNNEIASLGTSTVQWNGTYSKSFIVNQKVTLQWNATDQSLDFVFA